jgi:hypothetical protein
MSSGKYFHSTVYDKLLWQERITQEDDKEDREEGNIEIYCSAYDRDSRGVPLEGRRDYFMMLSASRLERLKWCDDDELERKRNEVVLL